MKDGGAVVAPGVRALAGDVFVGNVRGEEADVAAVAAAADDDDPDLLPSIFQLPSRRRKERLLSSTSATA